jgi:hypothetical protein
MGRASTVILDLSSFFVPASVSAGDPEIGEVIAKAMDVVAKEGVITVEESNTFGIELETVEGMRFDKGYISGYFVTDPERMEAVLDDPYILVANQKISAVKDLLPVLEKVMQSGKPIVVIAEDVEGEALQPGVLRGPLSGRAGMDRAVRRHLHPHRARRRAQVAAARRGRQRRAHGRVAAHG